MGKQKGLTAARARPEPTRLFTGDELRTPFAAIARAIRYVGRRGGLRAQPLALARAYRYVALVLDPRLLSTVPPLRAGPYAEKAPVLLRRAADGAAEIAGIIGLERRRREHFWLPGGFTPWYWTIGFLRDLAAWLNLPDPGGEWCEKPVEWSQRVEEVHAFTDGTPRRVRRGESGFTAPSVARTLGVSESTARRYISEARKNGRTPTWDILRAIQKQKPLRQLASRKVKRQAGSGSPPGP